MKIITYILVLIFCVVLFFLFTRNTSANNVAAISDTTIRIEQPKIQGTIPAEKLLSNEQPDVPHREAINSKDVSPENLVSFAETLIGTPYKYASTDPLVGFDCSGFITYVFNHYNIEVPRSSKDFKNEGTEIPLSQSKKGDLILFTGTDSTERIIGHMGIIISNKDGIKFIHSSSGKAHGVVITELNNYYMGRFVKVIRVFD
ncbi:MAG: C40 family peptidase [Ginsengibacter sp.]